MKEEEFDLLDEEELLEEEVEEEGVIQPGELFREELVGLVKAYESKQRTRIAWGQRAGAAVRGGTSKDSPLVLRYKRHEETERELEKMAADVVRDVAAEHQIIERMTNVKGVGLILAARVVARVDIRKSETVSALWRYAGYGVGDDGKADRPKRGERLRYNPRLKGAVYLVVRSMMRTRGGSPYREIYDKARESYEAAHPDWTKGHCHNAALRKMAKVWLSHLWEVWRKMEGLPTRELYVIEKLGHTHVLTPSDYGWDGEP